MSEEFSFADLDRLLQVGVLGNYQSLEVTSVLLIERAAATSQNYNLLTVIVGQNGRHHHTRELNFLGGRIRLPGLSNLSFGISQHELSLDELAAELEAATGRRQWVSGGSTLHFGNLQFRGPWFAPADGAGDETPLNQILKNNFWKGSHVYEWTDIDKGPFRLLLEEPRRLQDLSEEISSRLPIRIGGLSDRLGGLIVQLPVQVLQADFTGRGNRGGAEGELHWLPGVQARPLTVSVSHEHDGLFSEVVIVATRDSAVELVLPDAPGLQFATIKDSDSGVLLGRQPLSFIRSMAVGMGIVRPEKRIFSLPGLPSPVGQEVLIVDPHASHIGDRSSLSHFADTSNRIYRAELAQLRERLELVQYLPDSRISKADRRAAGIADLRELIRRLGQHAVWLWDPFLNATDVLETLFFNPHSESQMRALSGANTVDDEDPPEMVASGSGGGAVTTPGQSPSEIFVDYQHQLMEQHAGNTEGLQLEFRARSDASGWPFHDRFIIFPQLEGPPLTWSLGTSVNSFGIQHHILQKVPDGRLIADAFDELWTQLAHGKHLIWKAP